MQAAFSLEQAEWEQSRFCPKEAFSFVTSVRLFLLQLGNFTGRIVAVPAQSALNMFILAEI